MGYDFDILIYQMYLIHHNEIGFPDKSNGKCWEIAFFPTRARSVV